MRFTPNIVTVLSNTHNAIDVVFRKLFEHNTCPGTVLVLDYMGRGAAVLSESNKMSLLTKKIDWFDINDKRHTLRLFSLEDTPHAKSILERVFKHLLRIPDIAVKQETIAWLVNTSLRFISNGDLRLTTLLKLLTRNEIKKLYLHSDIDEEEIIKLQTLLTWSLRFPGVYAFSEGVNTIKLENYFSEKKVVWIESLYEHLEKNEHHLISGFVDIVAENAIKNYQFYSPNKKLDFM